MSTRKIIESIQAMAGNQLTAKVHLAACEVESYDQAARTCNCLMVDGKAENTITANLMAQVEDGILILPSVGSTVLVIYSEFIEPTVIQYGGIDKIILNGGDKGGLPLSPNLVTRLNAIENLINDLVAKFNSHTHILTLSSGTGSAAPTTDVEIGSLQLTQQGDIENQSISQG